MLTSHTPRFDPLRRPWAVWLAWLIAGFAALAPTLSHALARSKGVPLVEICTAAGPRWVALSFPSDAPDAPSALVHPEHCPFCLHATDRVAPPPDVSRFDVGVPGGSVVPTAEQALLSVTQSAPTPPPRGPPGVLFAI